MRAGRLGGLAIRGQAPGLGGRVGVAWAVELGGMDAWGCWVGLGGRFGQLSWAERLGRVVSA
eukprot:365392-Chlamydomonas_euryale.AAC.1